MRSPQDNPEARLSLFQSPGEKNSHIMSTGFCKQYNLRTHLQFPSNPVPAPRDHQQDQWSQRSSPGHLTYR